MKKPNYRVRILDGSVIVEHRVSLGPVILTWLMVGYICYCWFSGVRQSLVDVCTSRDAASGVVALFLLLFPALFVVGWLDLRPGKHFVVTGMNCGLREEVCSSIGRSMGYEVVTDETADAMMKDIEKRGWWINPFRTDDLHGPSDHSAI